MVTACLGFDTCCLVCTNPCSENPSIMDYIKLKHDVAELDKQAADWKRKIDIANMERNRTRALLKSLTAGPQAGGTLVSAASGLTSARSRNLG